MNVKDLLPIGSVVVLNGGEKKLMIFGIKQLDEENDGVEYDYAGVPYPEGNIGTDVQYVFNHDDIAEIYFRGYEDEEHEEFIKLLSEFYERVENGEELSDVNLWALALGSLTRGVTVRAMTAAYATFANEGVWREARTYTVVKDSNGQVILDNTQESHVAMKDMTAWYITDMLKSTVEKGTGTAAQLENMTVAGKTGTTSRDFDRWFAGYTPYYTGVVWCGYNDPEEIVLTDSDTNPSIVMWQKVMRLVHQNLKDKSFKQPANLVEVTVCRDSGLLPSDACALDPRGERTVRVTLSAHDVPTETCNVHKEVEICNASGHVANEYCAQVPGNSTHKAALLDVSRAFPKNGVVVLDQAYAILSDTLPAGYYAAVSPDVDAINVECYIHSEDDLPEPEPEEDEEDADTADSDEDDAQGVIDRILNTWTNAGSNP